MICASGLGPSMHACVHKTSADRICASLRLLEEVGRSCRGTAAQETPPLQQRQHATPPSPPLHVQTAQVRTGTDRAAQSQVRHSDSRPLELVPHAVHVNVWTFSLGASAMKRAINVPAASSLTSTKACTSEHARLTDNFAPQRDGGQASATPELGQGPAAHLLGLQLRQRTAEGQHGRRMHVRCAGCPQGAGLDIHTNVDPE